MRGPEDVPPIEPYEILSIDGFPHAHWRCPRCNANNRNAMRGSGIVPAICRACFDAVSIHLPPDELADSLPAVSLTVLADGASIRVQADGVGGFRYDVRDGSRTFGGYDSRWSRHEAYSAAQRALQSRRRHA